MKPIDFNAKFNKHIEAWSRLHLNGDEDIEEVEEKELREYERWLKTPKTWLDGLSPAAYFLRDDAIAAISHLAEYAINGMTAPPPLVNRIVELKEEAYPAALFVLADETMEREAAVRMKTKLIGVISEMGKPHPYALYIGWIKNSHDKNELAEQAALLLNDVACEHKAELIAAFEAAKSGYAADCLLDILSYCPGEKRAAEYAVDRMIASEGNKAFYANCLGRLGDPEALEYLYEAIEDPALGYFDYTAIRDAIEELGGFVEDERDFTGDPDYEMLAVEEDDLGDGE